MLKISSNRGTKLYIFCNNFIKPGLFQITKIRCFNNKTYEDNVSFHFFIEKRNYILDLMLLNLL